MEIGFNYLYDRLAHDFPPMDLSKYVLKDRIETFLLDREDGRFGRPNTHSSFRPHSSDAILVTIPEDCPLEDTTVKMDILARELNDALIVDEDGARDLFYH